MTKVMKIKTYYAFDSNGHCGAVQAKNKRTAEKLFRERITDGRPLRIEVSKTNCPECGCDEFGVYDGTPVTTGGWHGGQRIAWGRYAGVHMARCVALKCEECGHEESVDPNWD